MAYSSNIFFSFWACRQPSKASAIASSLLLPSGHPLIVRPGRSRSAATPPEFLAARSGLSAAIPHAWCSSVSQTIATRFVKNIPPFQGSATIHSHSTRGYHPGLRYIAPSGLNKKVSGNQNNNLNAATSGLRKKGVKKIACLAVKKEMLFEPARAQSFMTVAASSFLFRPDRQFLAFFSTALNFLILFVSRQKEQQQAIKLSYLIRSLSPFQGFHAFRTVPAISLLKP